MQNTMPIDYIQNKTICDLYLEPGYDMNGSAVLKWCVDFVFEPLSCVCNMSL